MSSTNYPSVIINFAMTADGKVSTRYWTPSNFRSAIHQNRLQEIRARADALMIGRSTAEINRIQQLGISQLRRTRKGAGKPAEPLCVLVSGRGHFSPPMKIFSTMRSPLLIFTRVPLSPRVQKLLPGRAIVHLLEKFAIKTILGILWHQYQVRTLVCEGGPTLMRALLDADAITEVHLTIVPLVFGGAQAPSLSGLPGSFLTRPLDFLLRSMDVQDGECFLTYERKKL